MDATYKESVVEQLWGNPHYDYRYTESAVSVINQYFSEQTIRAMLRKNGRRFFYEEDTVRIDTEMKQFLSSAQKKIMQERVNKGVAQLTRSQIKQAKAQGATYKQLEELAGNILADAFVTDGELSGNAWMDKNFAAGISYRRGGHYYIGGVRMY